MGQSIATSSLPRSVRERMGRLPHNVEERMGQALGAMSEVGWSFSGVHGAHTGLDISREFKRRLRTACCETEIIPEASGKTARSSDSQLFAPPSIIPGEMISIVLQNQRYQPIGLDVELSYGRETLPVREVTGHLAQEWNRTNPEKCVMPGDRIIAVNGTCGNAEMLMKELQGNEFLRITLVRIENGQQLDDWEFVHTYQDRLLFEESTPPPVHQLLPYHGDQGVDLGFGGAVNGQIMSTGTRLPESLHPMQAGYLPKQVWIGRGNPSA